MSKIALGLVITVTAAGGAFVYFQHRTNLELRAQLGELRQVIERQTLEHETAQREQQKSIAPAVPASAATVSAASRDDVVKLQKEIADLKQQTKEFARMAQQAQAAINANQNPTASIPTKLTQVAELKNAGKTSPEATAETLFWAAAGGDIDALAGVFSLTDTARTKADAWFASLSETTRQQYGSPEKLIALMVARDAATLSGMQVLGQRPINDTDVGMRVRVGTDQGKVKDESFLFRRAPDGWRLVIPDNVIERYARQLAGGK